MDGDEDLISVSSKNTTINKENKSANLVKKKTAIGGKGTKIVKKTKDLKF